MNKNSSMKNVYRVFHVEQYFRKHKLAGILGNYS